MWLLRKGSFKHLPIFRYSTKCVRKELFCDGRINCAWPYSEPADEMYCREDTKPAPASWSMSDLPVIVIVLLFLFSIFTGLVYALRRFNRKKRQKAIESEGRRSRSSERMRTRDLINLSNSLPSYPPPYSQDPASALSQPRAPLTATLLGEDADPPLLPPQQPPSYTLNIP